MTTAALYLRVSTEEQVSNLSLDTQEAECRELCERRGWKIVATFREEGASAKTLERPEMRRMLAFLGKGKPAVDHVVVFRIDRLSRNQLDFYLLRQAFEKHGVRLVSAREEIDGADSISSMIVETFSVLQAQVDNLIRAGRAKTGMTEAARRGRWVWKAPIGYRHAMHVNGRPTGLELDPLQAPLVARAFECVAAGASADAAYRESIAAGLRNAAGKPLGRTTFYAIFDKPIYCGRLEVPGWEIATASEAPAIVSEELFARARKTLDGRAPVRRETASLASFPLRGVARCTCGRRLAAFNARGKSGRHWPYYRCQRCAIQLPLHRLEDAFERLLGRLATPEEIVHQVEAAISRAVQERAKEMQERLAGGRRRLAAADQRLARLLDIRTDGEISADEYAAGRARLTAERNAALAELAELTAPLDGLAGETSAWARRFLSKPAEVWRELPGNARAIFADRVFADGLTLADGEFQTPAKSLLRLPFENDSATQAKERQAGAKSGVSNPAKPLPLLRLSPVSEAEEDLVRPTGFEPVLSP